MSFNNACFKTLSSSVWISIIDQRFKNIGLYAQTTNGAFPLTVQDMVIKLQSNNCIANNFYDCNSLGDFFVCQQHF